MRSPTGVLEALLQAELAFQASLLAAARPPEGDPRSDAQIAAMDRYHRFIPSEEVRWIASLLFQLRAFGVTDAAAIRRFIDLHNAHIAALAADRAYCRRKRIPPQRLSEAVFSAGAAENAAIYLDRYGGGQLAFDASAFKRLLVEFVAKEQVGLALDVLADSGLLSETKVAYNNARVFVSTGQLEALYEQYLAAVASGVMAAEQVAAGQVAAGATDAA